MSTAERRAWLRLARTPNVGPVLFRDLISRFKTASKAIEKLPELSGRSGSRLTLPQDSAIEQELEAGETLGARLLIGSDPDFPALLAALDPPPPLIWVRGDPALLRPRSMAVVGARIASAAGMRFARALSGELGQVGYVVVSGMARGIDAAAHEGALKSGTVAVLAGGIDDVFPPENGGLYRRLLDQGTVVSERAVGTRAKAQDFPRRNRLISGLSLGVVVVEAEMRSGSLTTARLAGEQGREVFAVPGSPLDPRAKGTNDLIRQGATLCEGLEDVLRVLDEPLTLQRPGASRPAVPDASEEPTDELRERIRALLSPTPVPRDELVRLTGAPAAAVNGALMELALAGQAELQPGGLAISLT